VSKELGAWGLNCGGGPQLNGWPEAWCDPARAASRASTSTRRADDQWTMVASPWPRRTLVTLVPNRGKKARREDRITCKETRQPRAPASFLTIIYRGPPLPIFPSDESAVLATLQLADPDSQPNSQKYSSARCQSGDGILLMAILRMKQLRKWQPPLRQAWQRSELDEASTRRPRRQESAVKSLSSPNPLTRSN